MPGKTRLTPKQEAFSYAVGYENKNYTQAYRECYDVSPNTPDMSVWAMASKVANNVKVKYRIDEIKKERREEMLRSFSWTVQEAESELRVVLAKNKNDLLRAEKLHMPAKHANNMAVLGAISELNKMLKDTYPEQFAQSESEETEDDGLLAAINRSDEGLWDDDE